MKTTEINYTECLSHLKGNKLFKHLNEDAMVSLLGCFNYKKWKKSTAFFHADGIANNFFIILSGRLKSYHIDLNKDREYTVSLLGKNDVTDVLSLLDGAEHDINFEALDDIEVLCTTNIKMRAWMEIHPEIYKSFMPYMANRMRVLEASLTDNVLADIPTRLARFFMANTDENKKLININDLSHDELANLIGSTRAVVNRHIQHFKEAGIIEVERKHTYIKNFQLLSQRVYESNYY
tara:strand:+ start:744 stop:1451 length:708 start_codon:yes stop_codon:yes gene_type:complete